jgi:hypothetical protein
MLPSADTASRQLWSALQLQALVLRQPLLLIPRRSRRLSSSSSTVCPGTLPQLVQCDTHTSPAPSTTILLLLPRPQLAQCPTSHEAWPRPAALARQHQGSTLPNTPWCLIALLLLLRGLLLLLLLLLPAHCPTSCTTWPAAAAHCPHPLLLPAILCLRLRLALHALGLALQQLDLLQLGLWGRGGRGVLVRGVLWWRCCGWL